MLEASATSPVVPNTLTEVIPSIPEHPVSSHPTSHAASSAELSSSVVSNSSSTTDNTSTEAGSSIVVSVRPPPPIPSEPSPHTDHVPGAPSSSSLPTPLATSTTTTSSPSTQSSPTITATPVTIHTPKLITHTIAAAGKYSQAIDVSGAGNHKYGTQIAWYFTSSMDVGFSVTVDGEKIKPPSRCLTSRGLYTTKPNTKCHVVFEWDNSFSWITLKDISYEIVVRTPEEVEKIMEAELQQIEAKRRERPDSPLPSLPSTTTSTTSTTATTPTTTPATASATPTTPPATASTGETSHEAPASVQEPHRTEEKKEDGESEREAQRVQEANRESLAELVHQFRDSLFLQHQEWSEARKQVELKMKAQLDALEAAYKQEQQECEAQIDQGRTLANAQRQELLTKAEAFPELRELLSGLDVN